MTRGIKTLTACLDFIEAKIDYIYSTYSQKTASRTIRICIMQTARRFYHCALELERRYNNESARKRKPRKEKSAEPATRGVKKEPIT